MSWIDDVLLDPEDEHLRTAHTWWLTSHGYVGTDVRRKGGGYRRVYLHRRVLKAPSGLEVDHRNRNKLDNRRANLRLATGTQNKRNAGPRRTYAGKPTNSPYKGVFLHRQSGRWNARIRHSGRQHSLGYFDDQVDAARAYDKAALEHHGEFACINFPDVVRPVPDAELAERQI